MRLRLGRDRYASASSNPSRSGVWLASVLASLPPTAVTWLLRWSASFRYLWLHPRKTRLGMGLLVCRIAKSASFRSSRPIIRKGLQIAMFSRAGIMRAGGRWTTVQIE